MGSCLFRVLLLDPGDFHLQLPSVAAVRLTQLLLELRKLVFQPCRGSVAAQIGGSLFVQRSVLQSFSPTLFELSLGPFVLFLHAPILHFQSFMSQSQL